MVDAQQLHKQLSVISGTESDRDMHTGSTAVRKRYIIITNLLFVLNTHTCNMPYKCLLLLYTIYTIYIHERLVITNDSELLLSYSSDCE